MARRVRQSVIAQADGTPTPAVKQSLDLKKGVEYSLPTNQRSIIFLFFEFGLFFAAALAMWPVDQVIAGGILALAIVVPGIMYYYDGRKTPRSAFITEDKIVLKFKFGPSVTVNWDEVEYLQKIEVFERLSSKSRSLGWLKGITMKSPVILSNKAGDAAIYAYTLKKGTAPPEKLVEKE
jgi:hypothetical protein